MPAKRGPSIRGKRNRAPIVEASSANMMSMHMSTTARNSVDCSIVLPRGII